MSEHAGACYMGRDGNLRAFVCYFQERLKGGNKANASCQFGFNCGLIGFN